MTENYTPNPEIEHPNTSAYPPMLQFGTNSATYAPQNTQTPVQPSSKPKNGFAIAGLSISVFSLILSILPFVFAFFMSLHGTDHIADFYFSALFLLIVIGFAISIVGIVMSKRLNGSGVNLSVIGIILSVIAFSIAVVAAIFLSFAYFFDMMS